MRKLVVLCALLSAVALVVPITAYAANQRSWVSAAGSDGNACTQAAPCLTFARAILQTNDGGEINCLSGGDFGPVNITKSVITIDCGTGAGQAGAIGGVGALSAGVTIGPATRVILRNLTINGFEAVGLNYGIYVNQGMDTTLIVEHCKIYGFGPGQSYGINFVTAANRGTLQVSDTSIYGNGVGILVSPVAGSIASVVLDRVTLTANGAGLQMGLGANSGIIAGTMRHSVMGANGYGIWVPQGGGGQVYFSVEESSIVDNLNTGIYFATQNAGSISVGASTIGGNLTGVYAGSTINSFGNNQMSANASNGSFTSTTPLK